MKRFLKFPKAQAYDMALNFFLGKLEQADEDGTGATAAQVKRWRAEVAEFIDGMKQPRKRTAQPTPAASPANDPSTWPVATYAEAVEYAHAGGVVRELSGRSSAQLLKAALRRRWPKVKFSTSTNRYGTTRVRWPLSASASWDAVNQVAQCFAGQESNAFDGRDFVRRWAPTATGRELVHHGLGYVSLAPQDATGWDVDREGKRLRNRESYNF